MEFPENGMTLLIKTFTQLRGAIQLPSLLPPPLPLLPPPSPPSPPSPPGRYFPFQPSYWCDCLPHYTRRVEEVQRRALSPPDVQGDSNSSEDSTEATALLQTREVKGIIQTYVTYNIMNTGLRY